MVPGRASRHVVAERSACRQFTAIRTAADGSYIAKSTERRMNAARVELPQSAGFRGDIGSRIDIGREPSRSGQNSSTEARLAGTRQYERHDAKRIETRPSKYHGRTQLGRSGHSLFDSKVYQPLTSLTPA
jgi:hypothetical protein